MTRGVIEPPTGDINTYLKSQKEREAHQFLVEGSYIAGEEFQLNEQELTKQKEHIAEIENTDIIHLDPSTFNYHDGLTEIFRSCQDPFGKDIAKLSF